MDYRQRKPSVSEVLTRTLNKRERKYLKIFISRRRIPKIGILLSEDDKYSFLIMDISKSQVVLNAINEIIEIMDKYSNNRKLLTITIDKKGRKLILDYPNNGNGNIIMRIIAAEYLSATLSKNDIAWLKDSIKLALDMVSKKIKGAKYVIRS